MAGAVFPVRAGRGWVQTLNTRGHRAALQVFLVIVLAHWMEHLVQAVQIYTLGWARPDARGVLGQAFPWLVTSEALHYGYAIVMLVALWMLRHGFTGRARWWWNLALGIQIWHHFEHLLLLGQVVFNRNLAGEKVPTSVLQLFFERVELHLFYNTVVFIPMVVAMVLHRYPTASERAKAVCTCAKRSRTEPVAA